MHWKSKLMPMVAQSSCEAEFMALSEVCREIMWILRFYEELGIECEVPHLFCDSQSAIAWADDPIQHQRNKHIEIKYYYCRDVVAADKVRLFYICTTEQLADLLTKPTGKQIIDRLKPGLMGQDIFTNMYKFVSKYTSKIKNKITTKNRNATGSKRMGVRQSINVVDK